jgi:low temperature requirement protein LtrA
MTTAYDVRYTTDSVFERCARAVHLGTMIGFAEIGTSFNPDKQLGPVFKAMSLFLMVSRLALTLQYSVVLFQVRKYRGGRLPILLTAVLHLATAMVYFGISFRWEPDKQSSRVYVVWYALGILEMALHLGLSQLASTLSFIRTHLGERLNLLTLIILGEGVIILAKNVTLLVKDTYVKDPSLIMWSE